MIRGLLLWICRMKQSADGYGKFVKNEVTRVKS